MIRTENLKLQILMFPWVAYGHFTPYLHLANKLAERGHTVFLVLPKSAQPRLNNLNEFPDLIHFYPLTIPHVEGLPHAAETASDVTLDQLHQYLFPAFDNTQDQIQSYVRSLKPHLVIHDALAYWVPSVVRNGSSGCKCISYGVGTAVIRSFFLVPSRKIATSMLVQELMQPPPGFPSSRIRLTHDEALKAFLLFHQYGGGLSMYERLTRCIRDSDAVALRTCREVEGSFCDYLAEQFGKPMLLTGLALPEATLYVQRDKKWSNWLNKFEPGSVVYCAFGSQITLQKDQLQQLLLGFELTGLPFLVASNPPTGCETVEEAMPDGFEERVEGRGWVCSGWVPQPLILNHPSTGCFVTHGGSGSNWESLLSDCQIVLMPADRIDLIFGAKLMVEELEVAVEVEGDENGWVSKESLCKAIKLVMDKDTVFAANLKTKHGILRNILSNSTLQENYVDSFIQSLHQVLESHA